MRILGLFVVGFVSEGGFFPSSFIEDTGRDQASPQSLPCCVSLTATAFPHPLPRSPGPPSPRWNQAGALLASRSRLCWESGKAVVKIFGLWHH